MENVIYNAHPRQQWDGSPGNAPTPGFEGFYTFQFAENHTSIKRGDKVILHAKENPGWEKNHAFYVKEVSNDYIVIDTNWVVLRLCDFWDIELFESAGEEQEKEYLCELIDDQLYNQVFSFSMTEKSLDRAEMRYLCSVIKETYTKQELETFLEWIKQEKPGRYSIAAKTGINFGNMTV